MSGVKILNRAFVLSLLFVVIACSDGASDSSSPGVGQSTGSTSELSGWIGAWGAAPYGPFPLGPLTDVAPIDPLSVTALSLFQNNQAVDQSFRMIVHPTIGGGTVRIRLSNLMGDRPVTFKSVQIAKRLLGPAIVPGSEMMLPFLGKDEFAIPPGEEAISDPTAFNFGFGDDLAISFHVVGESGPMTWHAVSFGLNYVGLPIGGDTTGDPSGLSFVPQPTVGWFFLSGVDVLAPDSPGTIVAIGDSITDGAYEVPETNSRWPDFLAQRLNAAGIAMGLLNEGINSNTVTDVSADNPGQGPPAVDRFQRDVLERPGVRSVIIFEGTNDLSAGVSAQTTYAGIRFMVNRAHTRGLCVVVGTIMPRSSPVGSLTGLNAWNIDTQETEREALNELIRTSSDLEGIADFDEAMRSPLDPQMLNPLYAFPDGLHPNSLGFMVMADTVPIEALVPPPMGHCVRR